MAFRLGMLFTIHVNAVIETDITDQRNWMHDSADVIFVASWSLRSRVFNSFAPLSTDVPALVMRFCVQLPLKAWSHDAFFFEHSKNRNKNKTTVRRRTAVG